MSWIPRPAAPSPAARNARSRWVRIAWWVGAGACAVLLFYAAVGFGVTSMLTGEHARWRGMNRGPQDFGLRGQVVSLTSSDGVPLKGWLLPAQGTARGAVVIAHGIDHTRQVMLPRARFLVHAGYDVLALDLRGHGESGGDLVSPGLLEARDVLAGELFLHRREPHARIAALGVSYGAVAALLAAARSPGFSAVVADGAFPSGRAVYRRTIDGFLRGGRSHWWVRTGVLVAEAPGIIPAIRLAYRIRTGEDLGPDFVSALEAAPRIHVPVLLISGGSDWMVPTADARQLQAALGSARTSLVVIPGAHHDTTYSTAPALYEAAVLSFLARALGS